MTMFSHVTICGYFRVLFLLFKNPEISPKIFWSNKSNIFYFFTGETKYSETKINNIFFQLVWIKIFLKIKSIQKYGETKKLS